MKHEEYANQPIEVNEYADAVQKFIADEKLMVTDNLMWVTMMMEKLETVLNAKPVEFDGDYAGFKHYQKELIPQIDGLVKEKVPAEWKTYVWRGPHGLRSYVKSSWPGPKKPVDFIQALIDTETYLKTLQGKDW